MNKIILLLLVFVSTAAMSQVYKQVGPDGQVYFSDQPSPGAERIKVEPAQAVSIPPVSEQLLDSLDSSKSDDQQDSNVVSYTNFRITSPIEEESVRANNGHVDIQLSLQPALGSGDAVILDIDGEDGKVSITGSDMTIGLDNVSRGEHKITARIVNASGATRIESQLVTFYVQRVSVGR